MSIKLTSTGLIMPSFVATAHSDAVINGVLDMFLDMYLGVFLNAFPNGLLHNILYYSLRSPKSCTNLGIHFLRARRTLHSKGQNIQQRCGRQNYQTRDGPD